MRSSFLIALASLAVPALGRQYNIRNWCPSSINVYLAGRALGTNVTSGSVFSVNLTDDEAYFYTDANRKSFSSNGTRVGFKLEKPYGYYYMVVDPNNFNVGLSVEPDSPPAGNNNGRCAGVGCLAAVCTNSFNNNQEPSNLASIPTSSPPPSPLQSCLSDDTSYTITFCPAERWPPTSLALRPNGNSEWCLDVQGAKFENGTPVQLYKCNGTPAQQWVYNGFSTKVKLASTNFCLDAGSNPGNGVGMKIWQCYDNLPAQAWYYTDDARLALEGKGQCLDLASGTKANGALVQTWQCTDNNNNQVWTP